MKMKRKNGEEKLEEIKKIKKRSSKEVHIENTQEITELNKC